MKMKRGEGMESYELLDDATNHASAVSGSVERKQGSGMFQDLVRVMNKQDEDKTRNGCTWLVVFQV